MPRYFGVPSLGLIAARGVDSPVVGMRPLICAGCGDRETEIRLTAPSSGGTSRWFFCVTAMDL